MGSFPIYEHVVPQSLCLNKLKFHIIQNPFAVLNLPKTINAKICNVVQSLSHVQLSVTPWSTACQASLSITNSWSLLKLLSIESVMPSNHLILCHPLLLLPPIFPSIKVFFQGVSSLHQVAKVSQF